MPRPKIRPEDRQRAVKACIPCKTSKKRCDSKLPCASCVRRNCELACLYHEVRQFTSIERSQRNSRSSIDQSPGHSNEFTPYSIQELPLSPSNVQGQDIQQLPTSPVVGVPSLQPAPSENSTPDHEETDQNDEESAFDLPMGRFEIDQASENEALPRSRLMLNAKGEKGI
jgi:hypothetical protein